MVNTLDVLLRRSLGGMNDQGAGQMIDDSAETIIALNMAGPVMLFKDRAGDCGTFHGVTSSKSAA